MAKLYDMKQCEAPESNNVRTGTDWIRMLPVTTSPDVSAASTVRLYAWPRPRPAPALAPL